MSFEKELNIKSKDDYLHVRLSKIVDLNSGEKINIKSIVGKNHTFHRDSLVEVPYCIYKNKRIPFANT